MVHTLSYTRDMPRMHALSTIVFKLVLSTTDEWNSDSEISEYCSHTSLTLNFFEEYAVTELFRVMYTVFVSPSLPYSGLRFYVALPIISGVDLSGAEPHIWVKNSQYLISIFLNISAPILLYR